MAELKELQREPNKYVYISWQLVVTERGSGVELQRQPATFPAAQ